MLSALHFFRRRRDHAEISDFLYLCYFNTWMTSVSHSLYGRPLTVFSLINSSQPYETGAKETIRLRSISNKTLIDLIVSSAAISWGWLLYTGGKKQEASVRG